MKLVGLNHFKSEFHSFCQPHAWSPPGKSSKSVRPAREQYIPKIQAHSLSIELWLYHCNIYSTFTVQRTNVTTGLQMLSYLLLIFHIYSGCLNLHMWVLGVKSWHSDITATKLGSLKFLHHSCWVQLTPSWKFTREGSLSCSFIFWGPLLSLFLLIL